MPDPEAALPATSGVDLLLELRGSHRRSGVEDALRDAVVSGRLAEGGRLPSSRVLAVELGLARNTVANAYGQLIAEGWLTARQGSGTRVAARARPADPGTEVPASGGRPRFDLSPGTPDTSEFPRAAWLRAARQALTAAPHEALGIGDPRGSRELREVLADYLARVRGVRTSPDRVVVCTGATQALHLLAATLRQAGAATLAVESHGLPLHREVIRAAGLQTPTLSVDESGARVADLAADGASGVLLTPAHQFPLGGALSPARRDAVLRWAREAGGLVVEDDYDGEFRFDRKPVGALQGLAPDLVAYVGTTSKTLAPGLRLAWVVVPPRLVDAVVHTKRLHDGFTGVFEQLTLAGFIRSGGYDRHVRRSRQRYRRRRDELVTTLAARTTGTEVTGIAAGLHALVRLAGRRAPDEATAVARAARAGLVVQGLAAFREPTAVTADDPAALVIGYARPPDHAFPGALDALCAALSPPRRPS